MKFAFSEEQEELRKVVKAFLDAKSPEAEVRAQMDTEAGYGEAVWKQMGEQLGLQGLAIPDEYGDCAWGAIGTGGGWGTTKAAKVTKRGLRVRRSDDCIARDELFWARNVIGAW